MANDQEAVADFTLISHLLRLHEDHDKQHDVSARGKLANLRYGMRDRLHSDYPVGRVFPAMPPGGMTNDPNRNEWRTLIASLFGFSHDEIEHEKKTSLGFALRSLYEQEERESLERRFMALLNADEEHLPGHLRQSISLLKSAKIPISLDWSELLNDVCAWNMPGKVIQKKWARDYYRARKEKTSTPAPSENTAISDNLFE